MRLARSLLFASLLAITAAAQSQSPQEATPAAAVQAEAKAPPVPLLWKVSDADNAVYVLGSFHLLKPDDYPLSPEVDAAFADAEQVVFEMAPEEMASPTLGMQMGQAALRTDGTSLDSEIAPDIAAKLRSWVASNAEHLQKGGMQGPMLQMFEPWFVGLMVSLTEMTKMGLDPQLGLDMHFAKAAKDAGKPTAGLETGAQQIAFLDGMDKDEQLQMLAEALDESTEGRAEMEQLHRQWREGDAQGIWQGMAAEMKSEYPQLYQRINVQRNDTWVGKIEQRLKSDKDDTLLVVGALHALGEDGIVEKLQARGYQVERICSACSGDVDAQPAN
jgi:uncharacterized protein YbaP (TraB family)